MTFKKQMEKYLLELRGSDDWSDTEYDLSAGLWAMVKLGKCESALLAALPVLREHTLCKLSKDHEEAVINIGRQVEQALGDNDDDV